MTELISKEERELVAYREEIAVRYAEKFLRRIFNEEVDRDRYRLMRAADGDDFYIQFDSGKPRTPYTSWENVYSIYIPAIRGEYSRAFCRMVFWTKAPAVHENGCYVWFLELDPFVSALVAIREHLVDGIAMTRERFLSAVNGDGVYVQTNPAKRV